MRIDFNISQTEAGKFRTACEATIRNVARGTKEATEYAAWSIMSDSLDQVPIDTGTLISSAYLGISRRSDVKGYVYGAILGYGDDEGLAGQVDFGPIDWAMRPTNNVNPKSGLQASTYAAKVHEDLDMPHPNGGKAKFLEDPIRNWAAGKFARTAMTYWKQSIEYFNMGHIHESYRRSTKRTHAPGWQRFSRIEAHVKFKQVGSGVQRGGEYVRRGESK